MELPQILMALPNIEGNFIAVPTFIILQVHKRVLR